MTLVPHPLLAATAALILLLMAGPAAASPGAHGPNGEHLDTNQSGVAAVSTAPRLDAKSELFELVGRLDGGEFSILIDRFDTNEPVLKASVEVASGDLKANAKFHEDLGDYAVDDPALLKLLSTPGEHAIVITVMAGKDNDLLDGVLRVGTEQTASGGHGHAHAGDHDDSQPHDHGFGWWRWAAGGFIALVVLMSWFWRNRLSGDSVTRGLKGEQ